jgi:hypothetical protein
MLKELIYHDHTCILTDGLDEISDVKGRSEIVDLIEHLFRDKTFGIKNSDNESF